MPRNMHGGAGEGGGDGAQQRRKRFGMGPVRKYMATRIRHLAEATAEQISKWPLIHPASFHIADTMLPTV
jgi:hypothetical protein